MSNLATITNNILADSGIDDINVVVTTGSYANPAWITALDWGKITGRPTTLAGYGITDAYTQTQVNNLLNGYLLLSGGTMTGQIVLKEGTDSTDYTKGLRFPNDPYGGSGDVSGLRLYRDGASTEKMVLELYIGNDATGAPQDRINFRTGTGLVADNNLVTINDNIIWNAGNLPSPQTAITLTTTGTSGAATFIGATLNIPQYQSVLTNPVTGTGASGRVAFWNGTNTQTSNANFFWDNSNGFLGIGTATPQRALHVSGTSAGAEFTLTETAMAVGAKNFNFVGNASNGTWSIRTLTDNSGAQSVNFVSFLASNGAATFNNSVMATSLLVERTASRNMLGISSLALPTSGVEEGVAVIKTNSNLWQMSLVGYATDSKGLRVYNTGGVGNTSLEVAQGGGTRFIVDGSGNVGMGTSTPIVHSNSRGVVIQGSARGILEIWDATNGKSVFQNVGGDTYIGQLDKGTGFGRTFLLVNGIGNSADIAVTLNADTTAVFNSSVRASGNANIIPSFIANNASGASGTAQHYIDFTAGATVISRMSRGNGASGLVGNGLNIDNFDGFGIRLNQLGGSGGTFNVTGGAATFSGTITTSQGLNSTKNVVAGEPTPLHLSYSTSDGLAPAVRLGSTQGFWDIQPSNNNQRIAFEWNDSVNVLNLLSNGNVGIGSLSPPERLQINGNLLFDTSGGDKRIYFRSNGAIADTNWQMGNYNNPTGATLVTLVATTIDVFGGADNRYGFMVRNTLNQPLLQIGGATGAAVFSNSVTAGTDGVFGSSRTGNNGGATVLNILGSSSSSTSAQLNLTQVWNGVQYPVILRNIYDPVGGAASSIFTLSTTAFSGSSATTTERFRIDGWTGNVGIATDTPVTTLQLGRVFGFLQDINSGYIDCNRNSNGNYIVSQFGVRMHLDSAIGEITFLTAPSGTAGNAMTLTPRLKILQNGNVGIGTATPSSLLTVAGDSALAWTSAVSNLRISRSGSVARFQNYDGGSVANIALNWEGGNVGVGTTTVPRRLTVQNGADDGTLQIRMQGPGAPDSFCEIGRESMSTGDFRINVCRSGAVINALRIIDTTGVVDIRQSMVVGVDVNSSQNLRITENQVWRSGAGDLFINESASGNVRAVGGGGALLVNTGTRWNQERFGIQISNSAAWTSVPAMMRLTNFVSGGMTKITFTDSSIIDGIFGMIPVSGASYFVMGFAGNVEQGFKLFQNGNLIIFGSTTASSFFESSDKRLKSNILDLDVNVSSIIAKTYLKNGIEEIGYLAQDVESILPSAISKRDDGYLDLSYRQVHTAKIAYLEKRITELEKQLKNN
jgi:hypothetical protein